MMHLSMPYIFVRQFMQKKIAIYLKFIFKLMFLCSIFGNLNSRIQNVTSRVENLLSQRAVCRFLLSCISLRIYFVFTGSLLLLVGFLQLGKPGLLFVGVCKLLTVTLPLLQSTGPGCAGLSSCSTWAQQSWLMGSSA